MHKIAMVTAGAERFPAGTVEAIKEFAIEDVRKALDTDDKNVRDANLQPVIAAIHEKFDEEYEGVCGITEEELKLTGLQKEKR